MRESDGDFAHPRVHARVGEALSTASWVGWPADRELVLALHRVDKVVGGVPGSGADLGDGGGGGVQVT